MTHSVFESVVFAVENVKIEFYRLAKPAHRVAEVGAGLFHHHGFHVFGGVFARRIALRGGCHRHQCRNEYCI